MTEIVKRRLRKQLEALNEEEIDLPTEETPEFTWEGWPNGLVQSEESGS